VSTAPLDIPKPGPRPAASDPRDAQERTVSLVPPARVEVARQPATIPYGNAAGSTTTTILEVLYDDESTGFGCGSCDFTTDAYGKAMSHRRFSHPAEAARLKAGPNTRPRTQLNQLAAQVAIMQAQLSASSKTKPAKVKPVKAKPVTRDAERAVPPPAWESMLADNARLTVERDTALQNFDEACLMNRDLRAQLALAEAELSKLRPLAEAIKLLTT
jgi:hypothetical protein